MIPISSRTWRLEGVKLRSVRNSTPLLPTALRARFHACVRVETALAAANLQDTQGSCSRAVLPKEGLGSSKRRHSPNPGAALIVPTGFQRLACLVPFLPSPSLTQGSFPNLDIDVLASQSKTLSHGGDSLLVRRIQPCS